MIRKYLLLALLCALPCFGQDTNFTRMLSDVIYVQGTSYTFVAADNTHIVAFKSASPVSAVLPVGTTAFFGKGSVFSVVVQGAGTVTITCSGCTINGAATLVLTQNQGAEIFGDGTNYVANKGGGGGGGGTNIGGSTALGNQVASDGSGFSSQPKPAIDVRDTVGIDCTGNTDSSTALNAILANISQSELDIPATCQLRADSQIVIQGKTGWKIKGLGDRPGVLGFGGPSIFGCNGSAGALLYINRSGYGTIEGLGIYPKGPAAVCGSSSFTQSVQIDSTGNPGVTTHDIVLDHDSLTTNAQGTAITNYVGVSVTDGGKGNGELIRVKNSWIHCQNSTGSVGVQINSNTSDIDAIEDNHISNCFQAVKLQQGNTRVVRNLLSSSGNFSVFGNGGGAVWIGTCSSGPLSILNNEEDSGGQFINTDNDAVNGCTGGVNVIGNDIGISDYDTAKFPVNLGTTGGVYVFQGNQIHMTQVPATVIVGSAANAPAGPQGTIYEFANSLQNTNGTVLGICCQSPGWQGGEFHFGTSTAAHGNNPLSTSSMDHIYFPGVYKNGHASPLEIFRNNGAGLGSNDDWTLQSVSGYPSQTSVFMLQHQAGVSGNKFLMLDGIHSGLTVGAITAPTIPVVGPVGGTGATSYTYAVVAYTPDGGTVPSPTKNIANGVVTLNGSTYNNIAWNPSSGASKYCVWRTVGGSSQGNIGCTNAILVPQTFEGYAVNSPTTGPSYTFNDTGLAGDSAALPAINTTGRLVVSPISGVANNCLQADTNGVISGTGVACGGGSTVAASQFSIPQYSSGGSSNVISGISAGTGQGFWAPIRQNTVDGTPTAEVDTILGDCASEGTITGAATTYTVAYTDVIGCNIVHDIAGSQSATITLPTPTTLHNPSAIVSISNYSSNPDTVAPTTWTISKDRSPATATMTIDPGSHCTIRVDPVNATNWKANCTVTSSGNNILTGDNTLSGQFMPRFFGPQGTPMCVVEPGFGLASCIDYLKNTLGLQGGIIYDNVPEDFTVNPFQQGFSAEVWFGTGRNSTTCNSTPPINCWVAEVPLILPSGTTLRGTGRVGTGNNQSAGTAFISGTNYHAPLGIPTGHTVTAVASGGSLATGNYRVQISTVNNRQTAASSIAVIVGISYPTAEAGAIIAVTGPNGSIAITSPSAVGSSPLQAQDYYVYVTPVNGAANTETRQLNDAVHLVCVTPGTVDATGCLMGSNSTVKSIMTSDNSPPLVDNTNALIVECGQYSQGNVQFATDLRDITLQAANQGTKSPNVMLENTCQEQSGFLGLTINGAPGGYVAANFGPAAEVYNTNLALNSRYKIGQLGGTTNAGTLYPMLLDGRPGPGPAQGYARQVEDITFAARTGGLTVPAQLWITGKNPGNQGVIDIGAVHLEGASGGDCILIDNGARAYVHGSGCGVTGYTIHLGSDGGGLVADGIGSGAPAHAIKDDLCGVTKNVNNVTHYESPCAIDASNVPRIFQVTSQKAETAADTNVLTVSPPAQAGAYKVCLTLSLSAANAATLGWTATWTDANGNAQSPTNLALSQTGAAAPALTFVTSSPGNYAACQPIDVDASGTNIVVKLTFSGTSFAGKATSWIERVN